MCLDVLGKVSKIQRYQTFFLEMAGEKVLRGVDSTPPGKVGVNVLALLYSFAYFSLGD